MHRGEGDDIGRGERKDIYVVNDHHKALVAWVFVRRSLDTAPNLITIDHHTDTHEAFLGHASVVIVFALVPDSKRGYRIYVFHFKQCNIPIAAKANDQFPEEWICRRRLAATEREKLQKSNSLADGLPCAFCRVQVLPGQKIKQPLQVFRRRWRKSDLITQRLFASCLARAFSSVLSKRLSISTEDT